ncbi:MAG: metal ABC transporter ATP-binding protein, partial [Nitrospirales bacterium]
AFLTLQNAYIGYAEKVILKNVSLEIHQGASIALLGGNGSGKTTFLKTLAGILPLLSGSYVLTHTPNFKQTQVGYIPQRSIVNGLFSLKVHEVVEMGTYGSLRPWQGLGPEQQKRVTQSMSDVDLLSLRNEPYSFLSGGQQQRVLIARALASAPDILLLDEPLASLDQKSIQSMLALLTTLQANVNLTFIWADHALPTLGGVLQETLFIEDGVLCREIGESKELKQASGPEAIKEVILE